MKKEKGISLEDLFSEIIDNSINKADTDTSSSLEGVSSRRSETLADLIKNQAKSSEYKKVFEQLTKDFEEIRKDINEKKENLIKYSIVDFRVTLTSLLVTFFSWFLIGSVNYVGLITIFAGIFSILSVFIIIFDKETKMKNKVKNEIFQEYLKKSQYKHLLSKIIPELLIIYKINHLINDKKIRKRKIHKLLTENTLIINNEKNDIEKLIWIYDKYDDFINSEEMVKEISKDARLVIKKTIMEEDKDYDVKK